MEEWRNGGMEEYISSTPVLQIRFMSYINEALKKAQREKDALAARYSRLLAARREKRKGSRGRKLWWSSLIVILILLAFGLYSWLDSRGPDTTSASKKVIPHGDLKQKAAVDAKGLYERARRFQKSGRSREARSFYQKVLALDPQNGHAVNNIGVAFLQEKNFTEARKSFEDAMRLQPDYVDPYYNLACLYAIQGDTKRGLDYLKRAVSLDGSVREWALADADLKALRGLAGFEEAIGKR
jgi:tetratricopeptide (TPR) repeat protein